MATSTSSRLSNLRRTSNSEASNDGSSSTQSQFKLTLPSEDTTAAYQPTVTFNNTRTSMRLLKGKVDRGASQDKQDVIGYGSGEIDSAQKIQASKLALTLEQPPADLKLFLRDSPQESSKKIISDVTKPAEKKRLLIAKEPTKQQPQQHAPPKKPQPTLPSRVQAPPAGSPSPQVPPGHDIDRPIREEEVEESRDGAQNESDLVMCPEGCGRKFNRKALEKHQKACKIVFMSKRKQFNSEAKRITSKEQADIVKQTKIKEKKDLTKTKGKGFEKTSDNWKAASQDFRTALKNIKKDGEAHGHEEEEGGEIDVDAPLNQLDTKMIQCEYCEKPFSEVFIETHSENCPKKKEKEKNAKKATKKK